MITFDDSKYKQQLRKYLEDFVDSSYWRKKEKLEKYDEIDPQAFKERIAEFGYPKEAEEILKIWQAKDHSRFFSAVYKLFNLQKLSGDAVKWDLWNHIRQDASVIDTYLESLLTKDKDDEEDIENQFKSIYHETIDAQKKNLQEIEEAISRIEDFQTQVVIVRPGDIGKDNFHSINGVSYVSLGEHKNSDAPTFTYFGLREVDDIMDAGDTDFFSDPNEERDYFNLVKELKHPGSSSQIGKILKLYTARPVKDREKLEKYVEEKKIPNNIFLTDSAEEAVGYANEYPPRDVWKIRIYAKYVTVTKEKEVMSAGNYQTLGKDGFAPVLSMDVIYSYDAGQEQIKESFKKYLK